MNKNFQTIHLIYNNISVKFMVSTNNTRTSVEPHVQSKWLVKAHKWR